MTDLLNQSNYSFSLFSLPTALAGAAILLLGIRVFRRERDMPVRASFLALSIAASIWLFGQSIVYSTTEPGTALFWARFAYLGVPFIGPTVYNFTVVVLRLTDRMRWAVVLGWFTAAILSFFSVFTDALFSGLYRYFWGYYARYDELGAAFLAYMAIMLGASMLHYLEARRGMPLGVYRSRINALIVAFGVAYIATVDFLPTVGVPLYPFGYVAIVGFVVLAARAITKYHLINITPAFAADKIMDTMSDSLLVLDREGIVRVANRAAYEMFRGQQSELVESKITSLVEDPLFSESERFLELLSLGKLTDYETEIHKSAPAPAPALAPALARPRCISISGSSMHDSAGQPVALVLILRDITEQKRAQEQVRAQGAQLAALHEISLGLMNRLDLSNLLEAVIARAASLIGTEHGYIYVVDPQTDELVARAGIGEFAQSVGTHLKKGEGVAGKVWESGEPVIVEDYSLWSGRSPHFAEASWHAVVGTPLKSGGAVMGVIGLAHEDAERKFSPDQVALLRRLAQLASIAIDNARLYTAAQQELAERIKAEEEITRLNESLERRVAERTEQLEAANKDLEAFSYSVSHDLRAPLRAITGFSNAILEDYSDTLDPEGQRYLRLVRESAQNMGQLIDDLLSFSRLGRQQMEPVRVDLAALARAAYEDLSIVNGDRHIELTIEPLPPVYGDKAMLRQVFVNLLSNSIKYTKYKDIACIEVGYEKRPTSVVCFVKDNGAGFDMRYSHKLFGVFQRLHSVKEFEGTGVGLALVQRIIQRHGGSIWAESTVGEGATFYFELPTKGEVLYGV